MPDVFTPAKRSEVMSRIRSRGNAATEGRLVALMKAARITGWRRQVAIRFQFQVPSSKRKSRRDGSA